MKVVRVCLTVVVVLAVLVPYTVAYTGDYEHKIVRYVALGDSIAGGYGLSDVEKESYVGLIATALEKRYGAVHLVNFGKNGLRSEQLLDILTDEKNEQHEAYINEIQQADLITLSIGSNDLLQYISMDTDFEEFRKNGDELFTKACERFQHNLPLIMNEIQRQAPQAQLFVNNIYNPCNDISFHISGDAVKNLEVLAENYIQKINESFVSEEVQSVFNNKNKGKRKKKYALVDVKDAFENSDKKLINMVFSWGNIDPHPNKDGHKVIADMIIPNIYLQK